MSATQPAPTMFGCVSHSPLIAIRPKAPPQEPEILAHCEAFRAQVEAFRPERILFFTNNHFAGFHYANMPAYCVGTRAFAVADLGGAAGEIPVPSEDSIALIEHLRAEGFDPGISYKMSVDHAVSQPLTRLIGAPSRRAASAVTRSKASAGVGSSSSASAITAMRAGSWRGDDDDIGRGGSAKGVRRKLGAAPPAGVHPYL